MVCSEEYVAKFVERLKTFILNFESVVLSYNTTTLTTLRVQKVIR